MNEQQKNPFEPFFDEMRRIVREEVRACLGESGRRPLVGNMLTAEEAAKFLNYSRDWVYRNWRRIGGVKVGKRGVRFSRRALEVWVASRKG